MTTDDGRHAHKHYQDQIDDLLRRSEDAIERDVRMNSILTQHEVNQDALQRDVIAAHKRITEHHPLNTPDPEPVYGQREGPRSLPPLDLTDFDGENLGGATVVLARPMRRTSSLANGTLQSTILRPALRLYSTEGLTLADLRILGFRPQYPHDGVVDCKDTTNLLYHNVTIDGSGQNGIEITNTGNVVRGCDISADDKAIAGHGSNHLIEDSRFRFTGTPAGADWGALKLGRIYDTWIRRVDFIDGCSWLDVGTDGVVYEDCSFTGSPQRGSHAEEADRDGRGGPTTYHHCTWERNGLTGDTQQAHAVGQVAPIIIEHGDFLIDLTKESGVRLWDNDSRHSETMNCAGSRITDTRFRVTASAEINGKILSVDIPENLEAFERNVIELHTNLSGTSAEVHARAIQGAYPTTELVWV